jgi:hypothetical protein
VDFSQLNLRLRRQETAVRALEQALRLGGEEALEEIRNDPQFDSVREKALERARGGARRATEAPLAPLAPFTPPLVLPGD